MLDSALNFACSSLGSLTLAAGNNPVDHVVNKPWIVRDMFGIQGLWLWSAHVGNLVLSGLITLIVLTYAASRIRTGPESQGTNRYITTSPFAHMIEVICTYLREQTVRPLLGDRTDRFIGFLWTIFFFILVNNLLGLVPIVDATEIVDKLAGKEHWLTGIAGSTATQNLFVTAALALIAALVINLAGVKELGVGGYVKHLTAGTPWYLWPLMVPIEIMGTVIKPVALALRLFANMTAGHILVAVLFMFAVQGLGMLSKMSAGGIVLGGAISAVSVIAAIAIYFLELFVALLQAFVFTFLTAVFISQLAHHHDDHEHEGAHGHEHAHAH
jgi:F-type H+-transporting ATPase subunit a